jgi:hypothetical protein
MNVCTLKMGMSTLRVEKSEDRSMIKESELFFFWLFHFQRAYLVSSKRSSEPGSSKKRSKIPAMLIPLFCPCRYPLPT